LQSHAERFRQSWLYDELQRSQNFGAAMHKFGAVGGGAYNYIDQNWFGGKLPLRLTDPIADCDALLPAAQCKVIDYPKPDGVISFDKTSSVYLSNTNHEEDQPVHLQLARPADAITVNHAQFAGPEARFCPAGVYDPKAAAGRTTPTCSGANANMKITTDIRLGDSREQLKSLPDDSVDLIVTSPPYADQRKNVYGGIRPEDYIDWFLPISKQLLRVLKPSGTFILNIKEKAVNGERSTYVIELILAMRAQGWLWTEEFIWHKKNCYPGKWPNRFRDSWERLLQFNKNKKFNMYQEAVMVPMGEWASSRLKSLSETDKTRDTSKVGSGFGKNISNWVNREMAYPTNVLHLATECNNKNHSAAFPAALPEWFIKLFSQENDTVLDPFMGSGTTVLVANRLRRHAIGIDNVAAYCDMVKSKIEPVQMHLCDEVGEYE